MEKDIGKINKNDTTDIIVRVDDFGGRKGLTIREFVTSDRYTGFTKQGVRILSKDFKSFKEMINSITHEDMSDSEDSSVSTGRTGSTERKEAKSQKQLSTESSGEDFETEKIEDY